MRFSFLRTVERVFTRSDIERFCCLSWLISCVFCCFSTRGVGFGSFCLTVGLRGKNADPSSSLVIDSMCNFFYHKLNISLISLLYACADVALGLYEKISLRSKCASLKFVLRGITVLKTDPV